jgi:Na+-driven multidrug efflux pump
VEGAALATVISRFVELAVLVIWSHLRRKKFEFLQGIYRTILVDIKMFIPVMKKSIPIMVNEFLWSAGIISINQLLSRRSLAVVPAIGIAVALTNLLNVVFVSMGSAVGIIIGQMLGAGEMKDIKDKALTLMFFTAYLSFGLSALLLLVAPHFPQFYNTDDQVKNMATVFILLTATFFPLQGFLNAQYFTIRSGGKTFITFLADSGFTWLVIVLTVYLIIQYTKLDLFMVYTISLSLDILKVACGAWLIHKGIWITNLVKQDVE